MKFDLPLIRGLESSGIYESDTVHSVYSSLGIDVSSDARIGGSGYSIFEDAHLMSQVHKDASIYLTMNGRMSADWMYANSNIDNLYIKLKQFADSVPQFKGIIFLDAYMLKILAQRHDMSFCEAVPSVNCGIDSSKKLNVFLKLATDLGYKLPNKIIPDRSLNHDINSMAELKINLNKHWGDVKIEILVNEGCIYGCPFKVNHDISISKINQGNGTTEGDKLMVFDADDFDISSLNQKYGCLEHFKHHPSELLRMPFVRPEDLHNFEGLVDIVKISGKIKGPEFLTRCFNAYTNRQWDGNLLELLDATENIKHQHFIFNDLIPEGFFRMLSTCNKNCHTCNYCEKTMEKISQKLIK